MKSAVNFGYAFCPPHRLCVCLPESSRKVLFDASEENLKMLWSDSDTRVNPPGAFKSVRLDWREKITCACGGEPLKGTAWSRIDGYIPALRYEAECRQAKMTFDAVAVDCGTAIRITAVNLSDSPVSLTASAVGECNVCFNTKWADYDCPYSLLVPIMGDRSDRIVMMDASVSPCLPHGTSSLDFEFELPAYGGKVAYLIRPDGKLESDAIMLQQTDWEAEIEAGLNVWRELVSRAPVFDLPDAAVANAAKAGLADIFVMRERQSDGRIAGLAGTQVYRSANTCEPCLQSEALGKYGYYEPAKENIVFVSQFQVDSGSWEDDRQWGRDIWATSGWKSYATQQYYLRTGDRGFLSEQFERMFKSARWSMQQRLKTKRLNEPQSPEWGLMPRGMGDCGLKNGDDLFGVFYPHNFLHCMGLKIAAWTARELGRDDVVEELDANWRDLKSCIDKSLRIGCITEPDGTRWIPGVHNKTSGSRWGVAEAVYPTRLLAPDDPLVDSTMKKLQNDISEGGLPRSLGWLSGGLWVGIALDAMAYVNILRSEADVSAGYLLAALNHATPLLSWCEERSPEKNSKTITGDLQHAWTPIAVTQFIRDMLVCDGLFDDGRLYLTSAVPRGFYAAGEHIEVVGAPTFWGKITFRCDRTCSRTLVFTADLSEFEKGRELSVQLRIPEKGAKMTVIKTAHCEAYLDGERLNVTPSGDKISVTVEIAGA